MDKSKWICCFNELPKTDGRYLICYEKNGKTVIDIANFASHLINISEYGNSSGWYIENMVISEVNYWQELPETPNKYKMALTCELKYIEKEITKLTEEIQERINEEIFKNDNDLIEKRTIRSTYQSERLRLLNYLEEA